jgi:hypothetical protein
MQRSLEPNTRITMALARDADKPIEDQPRIFARTLAMNRQRRLMAAMQAMKNAGGDVDKLFDAALDAAEICLTGWENMVDPETGGPLPFSREAIGEVFSIDDMSEIFEAVISSAKVDAGDKKKSE